MSGITLSMTTTGQASNVGLAPASLVVGATTAYTLTATTTVALIPGDQISLTCPISVEPGATLACTSSAPLASPLACTSSNKLITITIALSSGTQISSGTALSVTIASFLNPSSTAPTGNFVFKFISSTNFLLLTQPSDIILALTTPATIVTKSI